MTQDEIYKNATEPYLCEPVGESFQLMNHDQQVEYVTQNVNEYFSVHEPEDVINLIEDSVRGIFEAEENNQ